MLYCAAVEVGGERIGSGGLGQWRPRQVVVRSGQVSRVQSTGHKQGRKEEPG